MTESFSDLLNEVLGSPDAGAALRENALRRKIAAAFEEARVAEGLSVRELAKKMDTSISQIQRLRHEDLGGSLTLRTICRAAQVLGLSVSVNVRPSTKGALGSLCQFGTTAQWQTTEPLGQSTTISTSGRKVAGSDCESSWESSTPGESKPLGVPFG